MPGNGTFGEGQETLRAAAVALWQDMNRQDAGRDLAIEQARFVRPCVAEVGCRVGNGVVLMAARTVGRPLGRGDRAEKRHRRNDGNQKSTQGNQRSLHLSI